MHVCLNESAVLNAPVTLLIPEWSLAVKDTENKHNTTSAFGSTQEFGQQCSVSCCICNLKLFENTLSLGSVVRSAKY